MVIWLRMVCVALLGAASVGCLAEPDLKTCDELPDGTEGCEAQGGGCETFCALLEANCPSQMPEGGQAACRGNCVERLADTGEDGDVVGDTVQCRVSHARLAEEDPATHCDPASFRGGGVCSDAPCEQYCDDVLEACAGSYPNKTTCMGACAIMPVSGGSDADANTVECRAKYAAQAVAEGGRAPCEASSINGGGICGDACDSYCDQVQANCTGEHALFSSTSQCRTLCGLLDPDGAFDGWSFEIEDDTVQCRTYHASPPAQLDPATHCPHAALYNEVHCGTDVCASYCLLMERNCPGTYGDRMACVSDCEAIQAADGTLYPLPGNETDCRAESAAGTGGGGAGAGGAGGGGEGGAMGAGGMSDGAGGAGGMGGAGMGGAGGG